MRRTGKGKWEGLKKEKWEGLKQNWLPNQTADGETWYLRLLCQNTRTPRVFGVWDCISRHSLHCTKLSWDKKSWPCNISPDTYPLPCGHLPHDGARWPPQFTGLGSVLRETSPLSNATEGVVGPLGAGVGRVALTCSPDLWGCLAPRRWPIPFPKLRSAPRPAPWFTNPPPELGVAPLKKHKVNTEQALAQRHLSPAPDGDGSEYQGQGQSWSSQKDGRKGKGRRCSLRRQLLTAVFWSTILTRQ